MIIKQSYTCEICGFTSENEKLVKACESKGVPTDLMKDFTSKYGNAINFIDCEESSMTYNQGAEVIDNVAILRNLGGHSDIICSKISILEEVLQLYDRFQAYCGGYKCDFENDKPTPLYFTGSNIDGHSIVYNFSLNEDNNYSKFIIATCYTGEKYTLPEVLGNDLMQSIIDFNEKYYIFDKSLYIGLSSKEAADANKERKC